VLVLAFTAPVWAAQAPSVASIEPGTSIQFEAPTVEPSIPGDVVTGVEASNAPAEATLIAAAESEAAATVPADPNPAEPREGRAGDERSPSMVAVADPDENNDKPDPRDPFESVNRQIFAINMALDDALVLPVARAYEQHVPKPIQTGLRNMMANLLDPYIAVNSLLQGKPMDAISDLGRFVVNSTVGVLGISDPASDMGLEKHREDFGQTLGVWGVPPGPYVMLPLFGPSTVRDTVGFVVDVFGALLARFKNTEVRYTLATLEFLQQRVRALPAQQFLDEAFDPYLLIRNGYLQRRDSLIYDGDPPSQD
jgi:phospholipid-binding lipoprotein MlaA